MRVGLCWSEDKRRGNDDYGWPLVPVENVRLRLPGIPIEAARLAIDGRTLALDADGWIAIPRLELHDVVVVRGPTGADVDKTGDLR